MTTTDFTSLLPRCPVCGCARDLSGGSLACPVPLLCHTCRRRDYFRQYYQGRKGEPRYRQVRARRSREYIRQKRAEQRRGHDERVRENLRRLEEA